MNVEKLFPFVSVLLVVMLVVGVGVLVLDKTRTATLTDVVVANETIAFTAGAGTSANNDLVSVTSLTAANGTTYAATIADAAQGYITAADSFTGDLYAAYTYGGDTPASNAFNNAGTGVSGIATDWASLVVTIMVLSLILGMTIAGFAYFGKRR